MPWWGREEEVIGGCAVAKRWYENFSDTTVLDGGLFNFLGKMLDVFP